MEFCNNHGSSIPVGSFDKDLDIYSVNIRFLGGGASQNFAAFLLLENYIATEQPQYVVEIGSQKGSLSTYLANHASSSEQFLFHTFEIDKSRDWYSRENEGIGCWFEKLETISPYCQSFEMDVFSQAAHTIIQNNIDQYKTLIICDGGNKPQEINTFGPFLKKGDMIMAHDFGSEIFDSDINKEILIEHEPFCKRFVDNQTLFKTFIKL